MFIITKKKDNVVEGISETLCYISDTNYVRINNQNLVFNPNSCKIYEVEDAPNYIEPEKYCYTEEKGFYENPDWVEPSSDIPEEIKETIRQEYRDELAQEVSQNVYDA